jgi:hypothetical protein
MEDPSLGGLAIGKDPQDPTTFNSLTPKNEKKAWQVITTLGDIFLPSQNAPLLTENSAPLVGEESLGHRGFPYSSWSLKGAIALSSIRIDMRG